MRNSLNLAVSLIAVGLTAMGAVDAQKTDATVGHEVVIINSGSTNTNGYSIFVQRSGRAFYILGSRTTVNGVTPPYKRALVTPAQAAKLFRDIVSAMPLIKLPAGHGFKSASFGTRTYVEYKGQDSPDLSFPGNAKAQALRDDAIAIATALHIKNTSRHPLSGGVPVMLPGH